MNPRSLPVVIDSLLDVDCDDERIKQLIMSVHNYFNIDELIEVVEKRNRSVISNFIFLFRLNKEICL